ERPHSARRAARARFDTSDRPERLTLWTLAAGSRTRATRRPPGDVRPAARRPGVRPSIRRGYRDRAPPNAQHVAAARSHLFGPQRSARLTRTREGLWRNDRGVVAGVCPPARQRWPALSST